MTLPWRPHPSPSASILEAIQGLREHIDREFCAIREQLDREFPHIGAQLHAIRTKPEAPETAEAPRGERP